MQAWKSVIKFMHSHWTHMQYNARMRMCNVPHIRRYFELNSCSVYELAKFCRNDKFLSFFCKTALQNRAIFHRRPSDSERQHIVDDSYLVSLPCIFLCPAVHTFVCLCVVCACLYVCVYVYIYICMYCVNIRGCGMYAGTWIWIYMHIYKYVYICICMCIYIYIHVYVCIYLNSNIYTHAYVLRIFMCLHTCLSFVFSHKTHTCTHNLSVSLSHTHIHQHTHAPIRTRRQSKASSFGERPSGKWGRWRQRCAHERCGCQKRKPL